MQKTYFLLRYSLDPFILYRLQPSKLDLDVLLAVTQVKIDSRKYPSIAQWKRLVTSYSEEKQRR